MSKKLTTSAMQRVSSLLDNRSAFARFARFTAGFCMAIPFYLIAVDEITDRKELWALLLPVGLTLLPLLIPSLVRAIDDKNLGLWITIGGTALLLALYFLFAEDRDNIRGSISAYVRMRNPHIFGMLLSIAAMLFMANGVVYWQKKERIGFKEGGWRSFINLLQGILLLGVIVIPFDKHPSLHLVVALTFFIGCSFGTIARETTPGKRMQQRIVDFIPAIIMAIAMLIHFGQEKLGWILPPPLNKINLFGAESIALWVTGIDFILVSLKREIDPKRREAVGKRSMQMAPPPQSN